MDGVRMTGWKADCPRLVRFPLDKGLFPRAMGEGVGAVLSIKVTAGDDARAFEALVEFRSILAALAVVRTLLPVYL